MIQYRPISKTSDTRRPQSNKKFFHRDKNIVLIARRSIIFSDAAFFIEKPESLKFEVIITETYGDKITTPAAEQRPKIAS